MICITLTLLVEIYREDLDQKLKAKEEKEKKEQESPAGRKKVNGIFIWY